MVSSKNQNYNVIYRPIKYPRIEFKTGNLTLILPYGYKPETLIEKHQKWIKEKCKLIEEVLQEAKNKKPVKRSEEEFKNIVYHSVAEFSKELGVKINKILFRKMKTKWGSYSPNKNLTINTLAKYLPTPLIRYLTYHELTHAIEKRHNQRFWEKISKKYPNYQRFEKKLFTFWFILHKNRYFLIIL